MLEVFLQLLCGLAILLRSLQIFSRARLHLYFKARAAWRWYNYLEHHFQPARKMLRINMDETSVFVCPAHGKGAVFAPRESGQRVSLGQRRQTVTLVSFVCDDVALQPLMPQVVLCNRRSFPRRAEKRVRKALPGHIQLIQKASAWNDNSTLAHIVTDLGKRLQPYRGNVQPVLIMDACRLHVHRKVLEKCASAGIVIILIPPLTTFMLQPLDADPYGFNMFKAALRREFQAARMGGDTIEVSFEVFLSCVGRAVDRSFLKRDWASVFDRLGFGLGQTQISDRVRNLLPVNADVAVGQQRPDTNDLRFCFPRSARIPERLLWRVIDGAPYQPASRSRVRSRAETEISDCILRDGAKRDALQHSLTSISARRARRRLE